MSKTITDEIDFQQQNRIRTQNDEFDFQQQQQRARTQVFPGNKRSRLEVAIHRPVTSMAIVSTAVTTTTTSTPSTSEDMSQNRSMSYYEVPNQRNTVTVTPSYLQQQQEQPPALPPVPPPGNPLRFYTQINAPRTSQSRII